MDVVQSAIHRLEVGGGVRYFRLGAILLGLLVLAGVYDWRAYQNMGTQEAMDSAQLARNLSEGKGYTTSFIRPLSLRLVQEHNREALLNTPLGQERDPYQLKGGHPDLANPPVYPVFLAGLMKVLPFKFDFGSTPGFWLLHYQPDFLITLANQVLFLVVLVLVFFLAQRLFDRTIAWTSAVLIVGSELLWHFSVSGLSTMLLILIFTLLVWTLVLLEEETREPKGGAGRLVALAVTAGLLVGVGALTRYSFGWLILPVVIFVAAVAGMRQAPMTAAAAFLTFALCLSPWIARNFMVSGTPFGTASYNLVDGENIYPDHSLERSLTQDSGISWIRIARTKFVMNARDILRSDVPYICGSWVSAFFLVGLLVSPPAPSVRRLRYFLLGSLVLLAIAQAMGRTQLSQDSPEINSENLLVLLGPLVVVYGVSFFYLLLEHVELPFREARSVAIGIFILVACLPLVLKILPPRTNPLARPYVPPSLQATGTLAKPGELTVSDVPWAMAWYGQRDSLWLPVKMDPDFFDIYKEKEVPLLLLSRKTLEKLDSRDLTQWHQTGEPNWSLLLLKCLEAFPVGTNRTSWPKMINPLLAFPNHPATILPWKFWQPGWPEQLVLTREGFTPQQWLLFLDGQGPVSAAAADNYFRRIRPGVR